jgi:alpha-galactosidase
MNPIIDRINVYAFASALLLGSVFAQPADAAEKKLKVFILAGQSNMVGHSRGHTMGTLFNADGPKDGELMDLVFGKNAGLSKQRFDDTLALAKRLNELTGGIGDPKIKAMTDAVQKAAAETEIAPLKAAWEAFQKDVVAASVVSDRVTINSIADGNKKSGKLAVGYGGDPEKIGPEYGFGLSIARKLDGPILLIKTSWGGKSLNYDFRPPSRPEFKTTPEYAEAKAKAAEDMKRYDAAVQSFPQDQKKYQTELAAYEEQIKTADAAARRKLRKPNPPAQPRKPQPFSMDAAGLNYRLMNEAVHQVLDNLKENHPDYDPAVGYEIAGFVWFQGYNDQFNEHFKANYKDNMIALIKDIRSEYKTPHLPFVIGVLGTGQTKEKVDENAVAVAQRAAAAAPEFQGTVVAVESYTEYALDSLKVFNSGPWAPQWYLWNLVGSDKPYHYLGSGKFFVRLGDAFATAMAPLTKKP